jgi:alpha-L-fucosidase
MFVHWSHDSQIGSVISHSMVGASPEYLRWYIEELPQSFNPQRFDADEWAVLAKLAGMKYVVLTAKHHNGFCLWDTHTSDFNIMNTPYGKDILAEYVAAVRRAGLGVGLYYSPEDFHYLHIHEQTIRRRGQQLSAEFQRKYEDFMRAQVRELMTNYGQIDVLFIDGEPAGPVKETAWQLQPNLLITRGAIETPEQYVPGKAPEGAWEACLTMGTQWQYKPTNDEYKSGRRILEILIETRAKGGALLLNVGPKPDGVLPSEQETRLREVALWHAVNGEAIHETRPWIVTREENLWFTRHKSLDTVYVFITGEPDWPRGSRKKFVLHSVKATPKTRVGVLGQTGEVVEYNPAADGRARWKQTNQGLEVSIVRAQRLYNNHQWANPVVLKLEHVSSALEPPFVETGNARTQSGGNVVLHGRLVGLGDAARVEVGFEYQEYLGFAEAMGNTRWERTPLVPLADVKEFSLPLSNLAPGKQYQFRAIVKHPQIVMRGDHKRFTAK